VSFRIYQVITIPGDGIGVEVIPPTVSVLNAAGDKYGFRINWNDVPWGSNYFKKHQRMMPIDGIEIMSKFDAILLGAIGVPELSDVETLWGLLIPIRRNFDQFINLRPIKSFKGVKTPLVGNKVIDMLIIRENAEGEYSKVGGRYYEGFPEETALQVAVFTRRGIERVTKYAVQQAKSRKHRIVSATKSNGIIYSMPFWDEVVESVVTQEPEIELKSVLIDALAAALVLHPENFDVIVASNLFGDILSDLAAALVGSIGVAASGNINPERKFPSMFEPVHGSAPDIMGRGIANPVGAIQAGTLMLRHLGEVQAADDVDSALHNLIASGISTTDLGGTETTNSFTTKLSALIK
jgi:tartrate dehydrogenase/decarboxylase/D-malate dehydrogenase